MGRLSCSCYGTIVDWTSSDSRGAVLVHPPFQTLSATSTSRRRRRTSRPCSCRSIPAPAASCGSCKSAWMKHFSSRCPRRSWSAGEREAAARHPRVALGSAGNPCWRSNQMPTTLCWQARTRLSPSSRGLWFWDELLAVDAAVALWRRKHASARRTAQSPGACPLACPYRSLLTSKGGGLRGGS